MQLYNTLTKRVEPFEPEDRQTVGLYVCGPTVYDHLHIGNVRPVIVFDALRRYFEQFNQWNVIYVQNITDVDDKLIQRSRETGDSVEEIASVYTQSYLDLLDALGVKRPTHSPRATEHIQEMVSLIQEMIAGGHAYVCDGDVYFRVQSAPEYGQLSGRRLEDQEAGARIEVEKQKENPLDFTLWKAAKAGEPSWPSPWGRGRPGWHTECVVMSRNYLEGRLDIHAGGNDLLFPHHENEIAQASVTKGGTFFRFWLHNGMLSFGGEKMSKSLGNFRYAYEILDAFGAETVRYFYLSRHYRKPLEFSLEGLDAAREAVGRVHRLLDDIDAELRSAQTRSSEDDPFLDELSAFRQQYIDAMEADFNTVGAIGAIQDVVNATNRFRADAIGQSRGVQQRAADLIRELGHPFGLFQPSEARAAAPSEDALMDLLIELRLQLRNRQAFDLSDQIRDRLGSLGYTLKDTPHGTLWTRNRGG